MVDIATGAVPDAADDAKDAAAVARGKLGGLKGGNARATMLPAEGRSRATAQGKHMGRLQAPRNITNQGTAPLVG